MSIIIPSYNYEKYIGEAIKSALAQSVKPIEIIVVDDGSTDSSVKVIEKYPVKLIKQKNSGVVEAKNRGFRESKGRYVLFLDADDILKPNALKEYLAEFRRYGGIGFAYSDMEYFGGETGIFKGKKFNIKELRKGNYIHNSALIKREAFEAVDGYHERTAGGYEDWDLYLSLAEIGYKGSYVTKSLLKYRRHEGAISRNEIDQMEAIRIINEIYASHPRLFSKFYRKSRKIYFDLYYGRSAMSSGFRFGRFLFRMAHRVMVFFCGCSSLFSGGQLKKS